MSKLDSRGSPLAYVPRVVISRRENPLECAIPKIPEECGFAFLRLVMEYKDSIQYCRKPSRLSAVSVAMASLEGWDGGVQVTLCKSSQLTCSIMGSSSR